jgi:hypothetical protein
VIRRAAPLAVAALLCAACGGGNESSEPTAARYLVYTRALGLPQQAIWIGDVEGQGMRRLTRGNYGLVSPDGRTIAVSRRSGIFVVAPDGGGERFVARAKAALWLPDSRHLLAVQGKALVNIDLDDNSVAVIERRDPASWSVSPDGQAVAYDLYEKTAGVCDGKFDVYVADVDGSSKRRLTQDGRSSTPVWGEKRIAFGYRPVGAACFSPRVWTMQPNGAQKEPMMRTLPKRFVGGGSGFYGVRPFAWVGGRPFLLATAPTEWGAVLAIVNTRSGEVRIPDLDPRPRALTHMYVDDASRDGLHVVGAACGAEVPCTIRIYSVDGGRSRELATGRVAYPDWNR